jgi:prealbumin domain-containing protein
MGSRSSRLLKPLLAAGAAAAVVIGSAVLVSATLSGTTFEGNDGNLLVDTTNNTDWCNQPTSFTGTCAAGDKVAGFAGKADKPSGSTDNAFGQGTKENNSAVTIVNGSIPPNKNDLTRFYIGSENISNVNFLYLGWERAVNIGSANLDFELNQHPTPSGCTTSCWSATTTGALTINRTAGDLLVTYDFAGSGTPTLGLLRWATSTSAPDPSGISGYTGGNVCFSGGFPCWADHQDLTSLGDAEGAVNTGSVYDPISLDAADPAHTVATGLFGEASINLTAAGVFPAGTCEALGSAFVKSRSSTSFTAELKDFIAPAKVNISNCGEIKIIKHTDTRGLDHDFSYSTNVPSGTATSAATFSKAPATTGTTTTFSLNDKNFSTYFDASTNPSGDGAANTEDITNVQPGSYTVTETVGTGWTLESLTCDPSGTTGDNHGSQHAASSPQADITVAAGGTVTCTYQNEPNQGAIKVTKTGKDKNCVLSEANPSFPFSVTEGSCVSAGVAQLSDATFTMVDSGSNAVTGSPFTTGSDGTFCVSGLSFDTYSVTETAAPTGYAIDDGTAQSVTVNALGTCSSGTQATKSFSDTPLADLSVSITSELAGATNSSISCVDSGSASIGNSPQPATGTGDPETLTADGLAPGTYTCTVTVDP